ncbi:MAG TPA: Asp-tRNA(Asn)/Glu-tRNA(Gln) amidotransferase subunit GatC [Saprospiraceae bacterium]|nr:Asp-tRNA(Asn)/Glu-tRNA(Gln) amidotransferase subunit GatC [Saprospiraceae bacterium]HND88933.1 Asp-tRNA(Asn)/Glu-tRNA(Gln) amidotransferase subunit GatC [Saprospiraceae bacterium]
MQIDAALISRLERLARLSLDDSERQHLSTDLQRILDMVDKLQEVDTTGVEPLIYLRESDEDRLRDDAVGEQLPPDQALRNAPKHDGQFFQVPKFIQE